MFRAEKKLFLCLYNNQSDTATLSQPMAWDWETCLKTSIIFVIPFGDTSGKNTTHFFSFFSFNEYFMIKIIQLFKKKKKILV